jgi:hypothetical protein
MAHWMGRLLGVTPRELSFTRAGDVPSTVLPVRGNRPQS